jgi:hypothetical protein
MRTGYQEGKERNGGSHLTTTSGGKGNPPTKARHQKKSSKSTSGMAMSMTSLLICLDETVSVVGVDSEDLENSWVMTGMAIAVKGMTTTSR